MMKTERALPPPALALVLALVSSAWLSAAPRPAVGIDAAALDAYLSDYERGCPYPGFSVVLADASGPVYLRAWGETEAGTGRKMGVDTPSGVASITKSFTALGIMRLVEAGKLELDRPVVRYLPWFRTADKENSDRITIRMLLANASGIPSNDTFMDEADPSDAAMERGVRDIARLRTNREPGASFEYANENWDILGVVIEKVSGLPYRLFMERQVFKPLGMSRTTTDPSRFDALGVAYGNSFGPDACYPARRRVIGYGFASGSELRSSARDMGRYLAVYLSGGRGPGGSRFLSADSIRQMEEPRARVTGKSPGMGGSGEPEYYGYGLFVSRVDGRRLVNHGGNRSTMSSFMAVDPEAGLGAAILFTADTLDPYRFVSREKICNDLLRAARGLPPSSFGKVTRADPNLAEPFIAMPPGYAELIAGLYREPGGDELAVFPSGGELLGEVRMGMTEGRVRIRPRSGDRFLGISLHSATPGYCSRRADGAVASLSFEGRTYYRARSGAAPRARSPDGRFSFPSSGEWTWEGPSAARSATGEGGTVTVRLLSRKESEGVLAAARDGNWLPDSIGLRVWLETCAARTGGLARFRAVDARGFLVEWLGPAESASLEPRTRVYPILAGLELSGRARGSDAPVR